jgi:hypothetical protein
MRKRAEGGIALSSLLTVADYWRMREKLRRAEGLLNSLPERTDLDPALRSEIERCQESKVRQYRVDLQQYEAAHPDVASSKPPTDVAENQATTEEEDWLQSFVDAGLVDSLPAISDQEADAFEPIAIEGRPVSEDIIEGRR